MTFDLAAHQRERIRTLERENNHLEQARRRLERILAITLRAAAGPDCDPVILLQVIEEIDQRRGTPHEELAQLLRDTDPDRGKWRRGVPNMSGNIRSKYSA